MTKKRVSFSQLAINATLIIVSIAFVLPLLIVISASLTNEQTLAQNGYSILPQNFTTAAYEYFIKVPERLLKAYAITGFVTLVGTILGLTIMSLLAYALSRPEFKWRRPLSFFVIFTMLFNGGMVATYIVVTQFLHLKDKLPVLILPYLVIPWFVFLLRAYFINLPNDLIEAARIDGASEWRTFFQIVVPLSTPALATVGLFCILQYWNDWWLPLMYINNSNLFSLQYLLYSIMSNAEYLASSASRSGGLVTVAQVPIQTVRMAMVVIATGPIVIAFLALQRYFVRGLLVGGVKGE